MTKVYLIVASNKYDVQSIKSFLDEVKSIDFWFINLPSTIFVKTALNSKEIFELISKQFGEHIIFITEVSYDKSWGILPKGHWAFLK